MTEPRMTLERLDLVPLDPAAAAALPADRGRAADVIGATLSADWPGPDLLDILPMQAAAAPDAVRFGIWLMVERATTTVVGDLGFFGPPGADQTVEIGYSVVPDRRRRGYATEAATGLTRWALDQPGILAVVAGCDPANDPSIRTLERAGFTRTGQVKDQLRWRLERPR